VRRADKFLLLYSSSPSVVHQHAMPLKDSFGVFDTDGSGKLSKDEFKAVLTRAGADSAFSEEDADDLIAIFDKNGDGEIDTDEARTHTHRTDLRLG
jgi:Ca2+-binding EF-hand superfamily protein